MASVIQSNFRIRKNLGRVRKVIEVPNLIDIQKTSYDKFLQIERPAARARGGRPAGGLPQRLPDQGLQRDERARLRQLQPREAEVRRRGVPPARHDLRRADQGHDAAHDLRHPRGRRAHRPRHQGAGGLLRRDPADDGHRHVHHQRHRARRRQPAAPQPRRLLRPRQGQDPLERQAPLQRARHPVPRLVARLRVRPEGHHLRPHRPPPEDARDGAPPRARLLDAGPAQLLLQHRDGLPREGRQVRQERRVRPPRRPARDARHQGRRRGHRQEEHQVHEGRDQEAASDAKIDRLPIDLEELVGKVAAHDVVDKETGEVLLEVQRGGHRGASSRSSARRASSSSRSSSSTASTSARYLRDTLLAEKVKTTEDAIMEIYRRLRPGDPPTLETAKTLFHNLFFNPERYDLSKVGRLKLNYKFYRDLPEDQRPALDTPGAHPAGHPRDRPPPHRAEERPRLGRRHRPPRQPPRPRGRRADGEPVPHRPRPHGARDQRAHEHVAGDRHAHAARPHQREAGDARW